MDGALTDTDNGAGPLIQRGWSPDVARQTKTEFYDFLNVAPIISKEKGKIMLGKHLYRAQHRFFDTVFTGLENDIHDFKHVKSRQLGISTGSRALAAFWLGIFEGIKGAMIFDTSTHKDEARLEITNMIRALPLSMEFPKIVHDSRDILELDNGSTMLYMAAGVKSTKTSGTLGRSSGINLVLASELCSWASEEGLESFINALAQDYENRLYLWESTGRGPGMWKRMYMEAQEDTRHQKTIFSGFWAKDNQIILRSDPDFEKYGIFPPSEKEMKKITAVKERYGWDITEEQLAWVRRKMDPLAKMEGDAAPEFEGTSLRLLEQPWVEEDCFSMTGSTFFDNEKLTNIEETQISYKYKGYKYECGVEFVDCVVRAARNPRQVELKVWEEPKDDAVYIVACDPAHGTNEKNDRSSVQILRCYADGIDQVAEYCSPLIGTKQFGWVIMSLCAWYSGQNADVYLILELQGGGEAVWDELLELKRLVAGGYLQPRMEERGLQNIFQNVRNYIYSRSDSMGGGKALQWKTVGNLKVRIMERYRDFVNNGMLIIRSHMLVEEMRTITREGDTIEAEGSEHDDRVLAMAFGVHCWEQRARRVLVPQRRTREADAAKRRLMITDQVKLFNRSQLDSMFAIKHSRRINEQRQARRAQWRHGK